MSAVTELGRAHLFGVKGSAISELRNDMFLAGAVESADSHAWDMACRKRGIKTLGGRLAFLRDWYGSLMQLEG